MTMHDDERNMAARRYLLKQLTEEEAEQFEDELLDDDTLIEETEAEEAELYDQLARGELTAQERAAFSPHAERERIVLADALAAYARPRPFRMGRVLSLAASFLILFGAALFWRLNPEPAAPPPSVPRATLVKPPAATPVQTALRRKLIIADVALIAAREGANIPQFDVASDVDDVQLRIRLNPADRFPAYVVDVTTRDEETISSERVTRDPSSSSLSLTIPAARLRGRTARIAVSGIGSDGARELLGVQNATFRGQ